MGRGGAPEVIVNIERAADVLLALMDGRAR
jgi:hypothetical protein